MSENLVSFEDIKDFIKKDGERRNESYERYKKFYDQYFDFLETGLILRGDVQLQAAFSELNKRVRKFFKNRKFDKRLEISF